MIDKIKINSVRYDMDEKLKKYINKKIGNLDGYLPRHARKSAHVEIWLKAAKKGPDKYAAEAVIHLPGEVIRVQEATMNMFAAVDIIETKLKNLLKKYKEKHDIPKIYRRIIHRLRNIKSSDQNIR